ncbi:iron ABC transporter permease [Aneurinibacillus migulanus]|uniref:Iron ABC transporter permease n=1 Tax=Aneurinibacillus migulanus TaxID=47500 RepID=A0A0D1Y2U6_ANEMI|nr:iron ABC transporter permease [Aneurinibacillus migulanus]KIV57708.1 iron ABC transporter permease [Aneurinibacillus migulanus]KIV58603.1 iron ABC transporter permease [Aneurinibacillus migulanus]KON96286.1 iron ABC transporter permease [Aneurinibacillus migulanus]KPD09302.1 iron ABC transporter permease [Aneurinibacillus migulanus]MCP1358322.1 iron ABC transporter permease [Aneurinibacillus migulanus]
MRPEIFNQERRSRSIKLIILLGVLVLFGLVISMNTGRYSMPPSEVLQTLFGQGSKKQNIVLFDMRLPRIIISVLIGAGLAISGAVLQGISRNGLSDPGILGINSGAGLAVLLFVSFYPTTSVAPPFLMPFLALIGAGLTAVIIYVLSYKKNDGISPTRLLLTGIAVGAGMSAISIILTLQLNPSNFEFVVTWQMGSLWGSNWKFVGALLPWIVILLPYVYWKSRVMNILSTNEQIAGSLGLSINRERLVLMAAAVGLAASSVATGGSIGFVGLLGPHIARRMVGPQHQYMLPITAMVGALLVLAGDTIGRSIMEYTEVPAGVVISLLGGPYFIYLLMRSKV